MKKWVTFGIIAGMVIGMVLISGCTSSTSTNAVTPTASDISSTAVAQKTVQQSSDRNLILQGINAAETSCIGDLPRDVATDKCLIDSTIKEKIIDSTILKLNEKEQECLKDLPRSKDIILCSVKASDKIFIGEKIAFRYTVWRNMNLTESIDQLVDNRVDGWIFLPYRP